MKPPARQHCIEGAEQSAVCPMNNWFCECPCQPSSECFDIHPVVGPTLILVPTTNIATWYQMLVGWVDFDALGVRLGIQHSLGAEASHQMTTELCNIVQTYQHPTIKLPATRYVDDPAHHGDPMTRSSSVWVLTTWQSYASLASRVDEKRTYTHQVGGKTIKEEEII